MYKIGIIGAGQLGSRHLQSVALVDKPVIVYVSDVSNDSLKLAEQRFDEVNSRFNHPAIYTNSIDEFPEELDIVIIATNSLVRKDVVTQLLSAHKIRHLILEKFLFPQLKDYHIVEKLFVERPTMKIWVNCVRRSFDFYKGIAEKVKGSNQLYCSVTGSTWGLACNSIHFVDLFSFLIQECNIKVLNEAIDDKYFASKRAGYIEFTGSIYLGDQSGNRMELISFENGSHPIIVRISTPDATWIINENTKVMQFAEGKNEWILNSTNISIPFQSQVGASVIIDLLSKDYCDLSTYQQSQLLHKELLKVFLNKYNSLNNENKELCPIT